MGNGAREQRGTILPVVDVHAAGSGILGVDGHGKARRPVFGPGDSRFAGARVFPVGAQTDRPLRDLDDAPRVDLFRVLRCRLFSFFAKFRDRVGAHGVVQRGGKNIFRPPRPRPGLSGGAFVPDGAVGRGTDRRYVVPVYFHTLSPSSHGDVHQLGDTPLRAQHTGGYGLAATGPRVL